MVDARWEELAGLSAPVNMAAMAALLDWTISVSAAWTSSASAACASASPRATTPTAEAARHDRISSAPAVVSPGDTRGSRGTGVDPVAALAAVVGWQRVAAWAEAHALAATTVFADACEQEPGRIGGASTAEAEVGWVRGGSSGTGAQRIELARALAPGGPLAALGDAARRGDLPLHYVRAVWDDVSELDAAGVAAVASRMLAVLTRHQARTSGGQPIPPLWRSWRDALRRAVMRADAGRAARERAEAVRDRCAWIRHHRDGTATIAVTLPAVDATGVWQTLDTLARQHRTGDGAAPRTLDQARVDAFTATFCDLTHRRHTDGTYPTLQGRTRVEVQLHIDLPTLLALRDNPADLPGHGPIDPELARILATDATWRRLITDPTTGDLLDRGRHAYTPGQALRDYITTRHPTCTLPGCTRPAHHCQLDHITPWPQGPTTRDNLHPLCQRDHNRKTHEHWHPHRHPTGPITWTSPHGLTHTTAPAWHPDPPRQPPPRPHPDTPPPPDTPPF